MSQYWHPPRLELLQATSVLPWRASVIPFRYEDQPLAVIVKHLSSAKQRFESSADPIAKVAFLLLPLATMLALIPSDERNTSPYRKRAKDQLKKMTSLVTLALGGKR